MSFRSAKLPIIFLVLAAAGTGTAAEHAKVLPAGRFGLSLKYVDSVITEQGTTGGNTEPLSQPIRRNLTFAKVASEKSGMDQTKLAAFVKTQGWSMEDSLGSYTADLDAHVRVTALSLAYGLTAKTTVAIGVPIYAAESRVAVGFRAAPRAAEFLARLHSPEVNFGIFADQANREINAATTQLDETLAKYGYEPLTSWKGEGVGDIQLGLKHQVARSSQAEFAVTFGSVLPTGQKDDPDQLIDVPFGDGGYDLFSIVALDRRVNKWAMANFHARYDLQLPFEKTARLGTAAEPVLAAKDRLRFDPGDKWSLGTGVAYLSESGVALGTGYLWQKKYGDVYRGKDLQESSKRWLESETDTLTHSAEVSLGLNSTELFTAGAIAVPAILSVSYLHQLMTKNEPVSHQVHLDMNLFF